jgi:hypothetical protein
MRTWLTLALPAVLALAPSPTNAAKRRVCVEVVLKQARARLGGPPTPQAATAPQSQPSGQRARAERSVTDAETPYRVAVDRASIIASWTSDLPLGQTPLAYLGRLLEHFVTHEPGFTAARGSCEERLRVELYPLHHGWTAFAYYSGNGREERIDQLYPDELSQYAERAVLALLYDQPIASTIKRDTVLRADSMKSVQRIRGTHHFLLGIGTQVRLGRFPVAQDDGSARDAFRVFSPMTIGSGYQGKFENWSVKALAEFAIGTSYTGVRSNTAGGHVDLGGEFGISLHFLRYLNPRGLTSFHLGAGSTFEVLWFSMIKPLKERTPDPRVTVASGGLDVDLLCGWEFMRASSVQFFLEGGLHVPAYVLQRENDYGAFNTWFPGATVKLGVVF